MGNCCSKQTDTPLTETLNNDHVVVPPPRSSTVTSNEKYNPIPTNPEQPPSPPISKPAGTEPQRKQENIAGKTSTQQSNTQTSKPEAKTTSVPEPESKTEITGINDHENEAFGLLLAGAGESGKTTYNRQLRLKYLGGFDKDELKQYVNTIRGNLVETIQILASWLSHRDLSVEDENKDALENVLQLDPFEVEFDNYVVEHLQQLWEDPQIQNAFKNRDSTTIADHMDYFFAKLEEVAEPDYLPSDEDVLKARIRTIGITDVTFNFDGALIRIYDVGGQKNERSKWTKVMNEVGGLLFCVSLADFDKPMFEITDKLRIHDCLEIFHDLVHRQLFMDKPVFFLANKFDSFSEKIKNSDAFTTVFPEYSGDPHNPSECADYLFKLFQKEAEPMLPDRPIFEYRLSALNADQVCDVTKKISQYISTTFYE